MHQLNVLNNIIMTTCLLHFFRRMYVEYHKLNLCCCHLRQLTTDTCDLLNGSVGTQEQLEFFE